MSLNGCHLVELLLGYASIKAASRSTLSASPLSPTALSTPSTSLEGRDIADLLDRGFYLLRALEIDIDWHHKLKILELCAVNQDPALNGSKGRVSDPIFKVVDLHGFFKGWHIPLGKSCDNK
jgi:hypothetical protein